MANDIRYRYILQDLYTKVAAKVNNANNKLRVSSKKLSDQTQVTARNVAVQNKTFGGGIKNVLALAGAYLSAGKLISSGTALQDSLADLSAITGATGGDLEKLTVKISEMSKAAVVSGPEVGEAIKLVASAKPELLDNLDALTATTEQVLLLKNAAGIELSEAANITAQGLNIFGKGAEDAAKFVNILAAGAKFGASEIADTGEAMLIAGPAARAAGLDFAQLNAAIQATAKGGIKGARAGTAINAILGRLRRQGLDIQNLGLEKTFDIIGKKLDSISNPTARAQAEAKLFGEEHAKVGLALISNSRLLGNLESKLRGTNVAQEQADIRLATFSKRWEKLKITMTDIIAKVFLKLEPILSKQVEAFSAWVDSLDDEQIAAFTDSMAVMLKIVIKVGEAVKIVAQHIKAVVTLMSELAAAVVNMDFSGEFTGLKDLSKSGGLLGAGLNFLGIGGGEKATVPQSGTSSSRADINVNLRAPQGAIESVKHKTTGKQTGLNVGVNMVEQF